MGSKICGKCGDVKPLDDFHKNAKGRKGRTSVCKACVSAEKAIHYLRHADKIKAQKRAYRAANLDKFKAKDAAYAAANPDKIKARNAAYRATRREEHIADKNARRATRLGIAGPHATGPELRALVVKLDGKCQYCGEPFEQFDHIVPLARGGSNAISNITLACESCNLRKGNRTATEFKADSHQVQDQASGRNARPVAAFSDVA